MDGVYILATCSNVDFYVMAAVMTLLAIVTIGFTIYLFIDYDRFTGLLFSVISALLIAASVILWYQSFNTQRYKVTVDESISFVEFMDNYKIISRDGEIFTVKSIDNE